MMCSRNQRINRSFKLACLKERRMEREADTGGEVAKLTSTKGLVEEVFVYYRVSRGAYRLAE